MSFTRTMIGMALAAWLASAAPLAQANAVADPHAAQRAHLAPETTRSNARYALPQVELVRDDARRVHLGDELDDGRPVVPAFIDTSCTTICPLTSQTLARVQQLLGAERERVHLVSVSIDPEQDTAAQLRAYARTFHAGSAWQHDTGTNTASEFVQRALGVDRGDALSHPPAILVRPAPGGEWIRMDGFPTAEQVVAELPQAHAAQQGHRSRENGDLAITD